MEKSGESRWRDLGLDHVAGGRKKDRFDLVGPGGSFDRGGAHHEIIGSTEDRHGTLNLCGIGQDSVHLVAGLPGLLDQGVRSTGNYAFGRTRVVQERSADTRVSVAFEVVNSSTPGSQAESVTIM
jgi:hypothetical protein